MMAAANWRVASAAMRDGKPCGTLCKSAGISERCSYKSRAKHRVCRSRDPRRLKCEGATGSLAILASDHGPSHPCGSPCGSRLPTMPRGEPQVGMWTHRVTHGLTDWFREGSAGVTLALALSGSGPCGVPTGQSDTG